MKKAVIPSSFTADQAQYLRDAVTEIRREIQDCIGKREPVSELYLMSPGKKTYVLTVADDGTLNTTLVNE